MIVELGAFALILALGLLVDDPITDVENVERYFRMGKWRPRIAVLRAMAVAENAGVRALLVHALNDRAKVFYEHYGFLSSPIDPMTLMLRLQSSSAVM